MDHRPGQAVVVGKVDTVDEHPVVRGQVPEPVHGIRVPGALGYVYVNAHAQLRRQAGGSLQGPVGAGEGRVHADHPATPVAQEPFVLRQAPECSIGSVPIGDPVGTVHPDAHLGTGIRNDRQRALDGLW